MKAEQKNLAVGILSLCLAVILSYQPIYSNKLIGNTILVPIQKGSGTFYPSSVLIIFLIIFGCIKITQSNKFVKSKSLVLFIVYIFIFPLVMNSLDLLKDKHYEKQNNVGSIELYDTYLSVYEISGVNTVHFSTKIENHGSSRPFRITINLPENYKRTFGEDQVVIEEQQTILAGETYSLRDQIETDKQLSKRKLSLTELELLKKDFDYTIELSDGQSTALWKLNDSN